MCWLIHSLSLFTYCWSRGCFYVHWFVDIVVIVLHTLNLEFISMRTLSMFSEFKSFGASFRMHSFSLISVPTGYTRNFLSCPIELMADSAYSDQTVHILRLIWIYTDRKSLNDVVFFCVDAHIWFIMLTLFW